MRILMLGNSFTYFNDMPQMLAALLDAEVVACTRGGAYLSAHLNSDDEMYSTTQKALQEEAWDYVVLQEQSIAPVLKHDEFQTSVRKLCQLIHSSGGKPVLYPTWAYENESEKLATTGMNYSEMEQKLFESYFEAAQSNHALIAEVGTAFGKLSKAVNLYCEDHYHPTAAGSLLAATILADTIRRDAGR